VKRSHGPSLQPQLNSDSGRNYLTFCNMVGSNTLPRMSSALIAANRAPKSDLVGLASVVSSHAQRVAYGPANRCLCWIEETDAQISYASNSQMTAARQFAVVLLWLVSYLTPAMACVAPDAHMNAPERACCRAMKNQCEQMGMSPSHGCCHKTPQSSRDNALETKAVTFHPVAVAMIWLTAAEWLPQTPVAAGRVEDGDDSPPKSPPSSLSVLRI
jgi:hypothetical protein